MKLSKVNTLALFGAVFLYSSFSIAVELDGVQKKLEQVKEFNSCTEASSVSKTTSVILRFSSNVNEIPKIKKAVLSSNFSEFEIGFDHEKAEYFYSDILGKEKHVETLNKECSEYSCKFNVVMYPHVVFPENHDNTEISMTFYDEKNKKINEIKQNIGRFGKFEFEDELVPFDAYMEDKTIIVTKMPSDHVQPYYIVGLHFGLDDKRHKIDVVVNENQAEQGVLIGYPRYGDLTYLAVDFEPSDYSNAERGSIVENKVKLYDSEKDFFKNCTP